MKQTRRSVLGAIGVAATVGIGATQVLGADSDIPLVLEPHPDAEYLLVKNTTDSPFNLDGYYVDFEYVNDGEDQQYPIPSGYTIPAGGTIKIATGAKEVPEGAIDMEQPDYEMNNSEADVYAILDADKNVVARSDQDQYRASIDPNETTTTTEKDTSDQTSSEETTTEEETTTTKDDSEETTSDETTTNDSEDSSSDGGSSDDSSSSDESSSGMRSDDDSESNESSDSTDDKAKSSGSDESTGKNDENDC